MKIALCFFGQPRYIKETYEHYIKYLILPNNITDIFFHLWWDESIINKTIPVLNDSHNFFIDKDNLYFISDFYKPLQTFIERSNSINNNPIFLQYPNGVGHASSEWISRFKHHFYSVYKSILLKKQFEEENNFKYDCVISARTDLEIKKEIILQDLNLNLINVSPINARPLWCNDYIGISNSLNMNIYGNLWLNMMKYNLHEKCIFHPEQMLYYHLTVKNSLHINPTDILNFLIYNRS